MKFGFSAAAVAACLLSASSAEAALHRLDARAFSTGGPDVVSLTLGGEPLSAVSSSTVASASAYADYGVLKVFGEAAHTQADAQAGIPGAVGLASAGWLDDFTLISPTATAGFATATVLVTGSMTLGPSSDGLEYSQGSLTFSVSQYDGRIPNYSYSVVHNVRNFSNPPVDTTTNGNPGGYLFGLHTFIFPYVSGATFNIQLSTGCNATGVFGSATCDLGHSAYWTGLSLSDGAGNSIADFTVTSASGTDYSRSFAPGVPEPTTWALMIFGFGSVGAALRRRRGNLIEI